MSAYYNEIDPYAAQWLRNLIDAGLIPQGDVDERSIADVDPSDLEGYTQCHFFAGLGGWPFAAQLAGWPDDRPVWTGSPPCQPFSVAGQKRGAEDERHLWPDLYRLLAAVRPPVCFFEQVAAAAGGDWLDGMLSDLDGAGYATAAHVLPACAVNAPHRRDRLWIVADCDQQGISGRRVQRPDQGAGPVEWTALKRSSRPGIGHVVNPAQQRRGEGRAESGVRRGRDTDAGTSGYLCGCGYEYPSSLGRYGCPNCCGEFVGISIGERLEGQQQAGTAQNPVVGACTNHWATAEWLPGPDGKARRVGFRVRGVADGLPESLAGPRTIPLLTTQEKDRVSKLRALGNAIVPQVAAEVMSAYLETGQ